MYRLTRLRPVYLQKQNFTAFAKNDLSDEDSREKLTTLKTRLSMRFETSNRTEIIFYMMAEWYTLKRTGSDSLPMYSEVGERSVATCAASSSSLAVLFRKYRAV